MISLSEEWATLSRAMYGEEFINELANLLKENNVETILECGCGDGYILNGLAKQGFAGIGIDSNPLMIDMAQKRSRHQNIDFKESDWLDFWFGDFDKMNFKFDSVICRGNSLGYVQTWKDDWCNPNYSLRKAKKSKKKIINSLNLMFNEYLDNRGFLYVDTTSESEINKGNHSVGVNYPNIKLKGRVGYDLNNKTREIYGEGLVNGNFFKGGVVSYLLIPNELEKMLRSFNPSKIWRPKLKHETNYDIVCVRK